MSFSHKFVFYALNQFISSLSPVASLGLPWTTVDDGTVREGRTEDDNGDDGTRRDTTGRREGGRRRRDAHDGTDGRTDGQTDNIYSSTVSNTTLGPKI